MKRIAGYFLAGVLAAALTACGGGDTAGGELPEGPASPVESRGLFLLERTEGEALDDLTAQETYLIHVYDLIPDAAKNVEMGGFESSYEMTLNGVNSYEPLYAPVSYTVDGMNTPGSAQYFMLASGYAAPPELGTVLAGGEPIRAMSIYKINTHDIQDDTTATFTVTGCDVYDCEL